MGKRMRAFILPLAAVAAILGFYLLRDADLVLTGIVETNIYSHYSEVAGKIISAPVELGQLVNAGDILAVIDDSRKQYDLQELEKNQDKKQAVLDDLNSSIDSEILKQHQNNITLSEIECRKAIAEREIAQRDYDNALVLFAGTAISQVEMDNARHRLQLTEEAVNAASVKLDNARQQLAGYKKGPSVEKINVAQADLELIKLQINKTKEDLDKYTITALHSGTVISKNFLLGSIVDIGYNIVDIASEDEKYIMVYIPKEDLDLISYGQEIMMRQEEAVYKGTVTFIDVKAQYTPREMQTSANKDKKRIKNKISRAPNTPVKIGETLEVVIPK